MESEKQTHKETSLTREQRGQPLPGWLPQCCKDRQGSIAKANVKQITQKHCPGMISKITSILSEPDYLFYRYFLFHIRIKSYEKKLGMPLDFNRFCLVMFIVSCITTYLKYTILLTFQRLISIKHYDKSVPAI